MVFINRYFYPDQSATSRVLTAVATNLAQRGLSISVLTSNQRYEDPAARLNARELHNSVDIHRLATSRFGRQNLLGRAADYLAFIVGVNWWLLRKVRRGDVIVCKTDPPMLSAFVWPTVLLRRGVLVNWLQDLFPEVAVELGVVGKKVAAVAGWMRNLGLKFARKNVVIGRLMAVKIGDLNIAAGKQTLIENGCDVAALSKHSGGSRTRRAWNISDESLLVMYAGNFGRAHPDEPVASVVEQLVDLSQVVFVFIGGGAGMDKLKKRCEQLPNCRFLPYQPEHLLAETLAAADIHLVALHTNLEGLIVPSKFYPIAAVGRPVIYLGAPSSDLGHYLATHDCGHIAASTEALKEAVVKAAGDRPGLLNMGKNASILAHRQFSVDHSCDRWESLLRDLGVHQSLRREPS